MNAGIFSDVAANSDEEGDLLALLSSASRHFDHNSEAVHDVEVERGVAAGLVTTLHNSLMLCDASGKNCYRSSFSDVQGLHVAVLANSLAMVLRCSKKVLAKHLCKFQSNLIISLKKTTEIFVSWEGEATIQQVALTSTIKTIGFVRPHAPQAAHQLAEILLLIAKEHIISADIRIDAACMTVSFLGDPRGPSHTNSTLLAQIEEHASVLISTLSTASLATPESTQADSMVGLHKLSAVSPLVRVKMVKRRCTIICVAKHFEHASALIRECALDFCLDVFSHAECVDSLSYGVGDNFEIIRNGVIEFFENETKPHLMLKAIFLLNQILVVSQFESHAVMECLKRLAYGGEIDDAVIASAEAFCYGIGKQAAHNTEFLWTLVDLTTFSSSKVRAKALDTLEAITSSPDCVTVLLDDTDMLKSFSLIILHGSDQDCNKALNIARQLARSSNHHPEMCAHSGFLQAVVGFVSKDVSNRSAHLYCVETILALLSNEENTKAFLSFRNLLPWLITFVNTTTADEDFKQRVISVIVRLSMAFLEEV